MVEITLPCCDATTTLEADADEVRCEACGVDHELAPDARADARGAVHPPRRLPLAA